jgi:hypothetical protein
MEAANLRETYKNYLNEALIYQLTDFVEGEDSVGGESESVYMRQGVQSSELRLVHNIF